MFEAAPAKNKPIDGLIVKDTVFGRHDVNLRAEYRPLIDEDSFQITPEPLCAPQKTKKRDDLQCWRTVAILGVLVFHIWPDYFPNGFLGVDMFFVLSGFLMSAIIQRKKSKIDFSLAIDFYYRRVKRIVPVYLVVLLTVLFLLKNAIWEEEYVKIKNDGKFALVFGSNLQDLVQERDYFDTDNNFPFFKHCWSLAVEMQFYLIVPVMFGLWLNFWTSGRFFILAFILFSSLFYQCIVTSEVIRYESMLCRIWQFCFGILAQSYKIDWVKFDGSRQNILVQATFLVCLLFEFFPVELNRQTSSVVCVSLSALLISLSSSGEDSPFRYLIKSGNVKKWMVFCGDFSYILYLIHWPLITYCRFIKNGDKFGVFEGSVIMLACLMLSIFAHYLIENPMIDYCDSIKKLLLISLLLYSVSVYPLLSKSSVNLDDSTPDGIPDDPDSTFDIENADQPGPSNSTVISRLHLPYTYGHKVSSKTFEMFRRILDFESPLILPEGWTKKNEIEFAQKTLDDMCGTWNYNCKDTYRKWTKIQHQKKFTLCESLLFPGGNYTAVTIGNSHSECGSGAVHMNPLFKKVVAMAAHGCQFPEEKNMVLDCKHGNQAMVDVVRKLRPDFVFIITSWNGKTIQEAVKGPLQQDYGVRILQDLVDSVSKYSKHVIMNKPNFMFRQEVAPEYIRRKNQGSTVDFRMERKATTDRLTNENLRLSFVNCSKCFYYDYKEALCGDNYCNAIDVDTGLPMLRDKSHFNILGVRKLYPVLDKYVKLALGMSNNK